MSSDVAELERPVDALPVDWRQTTLGGALAKSEGGGTPPRDVEAYWNGDIPWASVKDVVKGEGSTPEETITAAGLANSTSKVIPAGTNIFAARMGVGAVVRYPFPVAINQDLMALTPSSALDPGYLFYWLQARKEAFVAVATGTTVKGIRRDVLLSFPMTLPPLDEQRRIAEVLRSVDEAIAANEAVLASCRALVGKLAQDVTESCETTTSMASLGKIVTGRTPSPKQADLWGGDLPFVTPGDLVAGNISVSDASRTLVADSGHGATVLPANSVLVTCIGSTVGKTAIARERCVTNQQINAICCSPQTAGFVYLACVAAYDTIVANAGKQAVPIINKSTFSAIEVPALSQAEMIEISAMVDAIDGEIVAAQTSLDTLHRTKANLMSDLLSGRVRVPA